MSNPPLVFTAERLLQTLQSFPGVNAYLVGFSGGADSTALLHALNAVKSHLDIPVSAVHVNHGLHADADLWQRRCENFCRQYRIELVCLSVNLDRCSGKGLEAEARHLRYQAIAALLKPGTGLLTAHHADDQAETLLLNLLRGSGVDGLSAMPRSRPLGNGVLQRPLLGFQNSTLINYLRENQIEWIEDPSNQYLNHDRNFVRHEVIPLLENRWPQVSKRLLLTCKAMTDARLLLERLADDYLGQNLAHPLVLHITSDLINNPELFRLVLRRWTKQSGTASIPVYRLETFYVQVQKANNDQNVTIRWGGWLIHLYKQQLWLRTDTRILPCPNLKWPQGHTEIDLGCDAGQLVLEAEGGTGNRSGDRPGPGGATTPVGEFSVGGRVNMQETVISQGTHHKSLKNLFQAAEIPPWLRDCVPLCKLDGELVAMGDWYFSEQFASWMFKNNIKLSWHPRNPLLQFILSRQNPHIVDPAGAVS